MRGLMLLALALPGWALSNAVTVHATTAVPAAQIHKVPRYFAKGEVAGFPRPHVDGVAAAAWQADVKNRWPDGSVRFAVIHFQAAVAENGSIVVDFRGTTDACHLGSQAVCEAAALTGPQMLDYRSGAWTAEVEVEADRRDHNPHSERADDAGRGPLHVLVPRSAGDFRHCGTPARAVRMISDGRARLHGYAPCTLRPTTQRIEACIRSCADVPGGWIGSE
ncbi:MAG: hypothetical protein HS123_15980 [Solibacteraceae bacterium]|nr:hypothetical protein [Solibacteraceae bacterium]